MFEKKAEEIANKRCHEIMCYGHCSFSSPKHHRCGEWHREYNCAKEGIEYGFQKANEWHYISKGDLPEVEGEYFVAVKYPNPTQHKEVFILSYTSDYEDEEKLGWYDSEGTNFDEEVYAWCEKLKAPKEKMLTGKKLKAPKEKMLTGKKPCKDCDNGCNWEKEKLVKALAENEHEVEARISHNLKYF